MKTILTILMLCGVCHGYAQKTPPHAASTRTWVVGDQTWSDHINIPACNKTSFDGGTGITPEADCRNNPRYYYLYSWEYVRRNSAALCPLPWRVPTMADFVELVAMNTISATSWGAVYGGYAFDTSVELNGSIAYYWSATARDRTYAYSLDINSGGFFAPRNYDSKCLGYQVRCVK